MKRRRKTKRLVRINKKALRIASKWVENDWFDLYNMLCEQPFKRRFNTAMRILMGRKLRVK